MLILSPLEQFQILSLAPITIFNFDFLITNAIFPVSILVLFCISGTIYLFSSNKNSFNSSSVFLKEFVSLSVSLVDPGDPITTSVIILTGAVIIFVTRFMADRNVVSPGPSSEGEGNDGNGVIQRGDINPQVEEEILPMPVPNNDPIVGFNFPDPMTYAQLVGMQRPKMLLIFMRCYLT